MKIILFIAQKPVQKYENLKKGPVIGGNMVGSATNYRIKKLTQSYPIILFFITISCVWLYSNIFTCFDQLNNSQSTLHFNGTTSTSTPIKGTL